MHNAVSPLRPFGLFLALALATSIACHTGTGGASMREESGSGPTTIDIQNGDFNDMTVYVLVNGQRVRLGTAYGNKTTVLTIPPYLINGASSLRFVANPIAGNRTPVTEEINVNAGDQLVMIINPGG